MPAPRSLGARRAHLVFLAAAASAAACGSATGGDPAPTAVAPAIRVAAAAAPVALAPGASAEAAITLSRQGGYRGAVALAVAGAPDGITTSFSPEALDGDGTASTLTVRAAPDVAPGSYGLAVTGSGPGVNAATATIAVTVAAPAGTLAVTAPAAGATVVRGQAVTVNVGVARGGAFAGGVTVSLQDPPPGVTADPVTIPAGAGAGALTVGVAAGVPAGRLALTLRASGPNGTPTAAAALALTVAEPAPAAASLDGVYLGLRTNFDGRQYQDFWTFLPDGRVVDSDPYEGLDRPLRLEQLCAAFPCGTYVRDGGELRIRWGESTDDRVYDLDAQGAFNERGKTQKYRPLAPLNGLRLDATYAEIDPGTGAALVRITLAGDGRFEEERLMHYTAWAQLGAPGEARTGRAGGGGRYAVRRNTLTLEYDGGQVAHFTIVVPPGEIGKPVPDAIYVNAAPIRRVP